MNELSNRMQSGFVSNGIKYHLYSINELDSISGAWSILDDNERRNARKFVVVEDQNRFILFKYIVRVILSEHLRVLPEEVKFSFNRNGKPRLVPQPLEFNISHTGETIIVVTSEGSPIGVDIEYNKDLRYAGNRFSSFFNDNEIAYIHKDKDLKTKRFYDLWTAKEAYLKMIGTGMLKNPLSVNIMWNNGRPFACESEGCESSKLIYIDFPDIVVCISYPG